MAERMQIEYDLCSLFRDNKAVEIGAVKKNCDIKVITAISQAKIWDPFRSGKHVRDLYAELLVPKSMATWSRTTSLKVSVNYILNICNNCIYTLFMAVMNRE